MKLLNTQDTYLTLQPFESIEQLNANTTAIRDQYAHELSSAARQVLDVLHRYASKFYGVCYLSKSKIADKLGVTRRTVIRVCQRLEDLGIIAQYETDRKGGRGQSSNAIVFLTQISARKAFVKADEVMSDNMQNEALVTGDVTGYVTGLDAPINALKEKDIKITNDTDARAALVKKGLVSKLPKTLQYALAPFFDADELYEMTGVIYKAKASVDRNIVIEEHEELYRESILSVINAFKRGKAKSLPAVLYRAIQTTTSSIMYNMARKERINAFYGF